MVVQSSISSTRPTHSNRLPTVGVWIFSLAFLLINLQPPRTTLFPYTTLFRSFHLRTGLRWGGQEPLLLPSLAMELSGEAAAPGRSEEHTSELQSRGQRVCRLLLEKKKLIISLTTIRFTLHKPSLTRMVVLVVR